MEVISIDELLEMPTRNVWLSGMIEQNLVVRITGAIDPGYVQTCTDYCSAIIGHSLPTYLPLTQGVQNFYRVNFDDPRAHVKSFMHQVNFFEWNQDSLELFEKLGFLFDVRALSSPNSIDYTGTIRRISFQFYPAGRGYMHKHRDPVGKHQAGVLSIVLSKAGRDYRSGGLFLENESGVRVFPETECEVGDLLIFNGQEAHGVVQIDAGARHDPLSTVGRWMALIAVTKSADNADITNAQDLGGY